MRLRNVVPGEDQLDRILTIAQRELRTLRRTRVYLLLILGAMLLLLALGYVGGGIRAGFGPVVADLLAPVELLVPVLAVAFGYRAVLEDATTGELAVFRTYPLTISEYVVGVFLGRAVGVVVAIVVPLFAVGAVTAAIPAETVVVYETHAADSWVLYARFVVLTVLYGLVVLALVLVVSTVVRSTWTAIAAGVGLILAVGLGGDLLVLTVVDPDSGWFQYAVAATPASAYRGLVLELVVSAVGPRAVAPGAAVVGLFAWLAGALGACILTLWSATVR